MKFYAAITLILSISQALAFASIGAPRHAFQVSTPSTASNIILFARPDSSTAVARALEMSKKFGPASKEAAAAWDIVEEMDASDNRFVCRFGRCYMVARGSYVLHLMKLAHASDAFNVV